MIKYDYLIERIINESNIQKFKPDKINNELSNLVYIEGPNSSGKSTLLNIIALGLYGIRSKKINKILIDRMNNLINSDYQKLKYEFEISNKDNSLILKSQKPNINNKEYFLEESVNGSKFQRISPERFEREYNLIYDIPYNPTERLYDLLDEIKNEQYRYGTKISQLNSTIRRIISEISSLRDPNRIQYLEDSIKKLLGNIEQNNIKLSSIKNIYNNLEEYSYSRNYVFYYNECQRIYKRIEEYENKEKGIIDEKINLGKEDKKIKGKIESQINLIASKFFEVSPRMENLLDKNERIRYSEWKDFPIYNIKDEKSYEYILQEIEYYNLLFRRKRQDIESDPVFQNAQIFKDLVRILKNYEYSPITIPKIGINLKELIAILEEENKKYKLIIDKYNVIENVMNELDIIKGEIEKINKILFKMKNIKYRDEEISEEVKEVISEQTNIQQLKAEYTDKLDKLKLFRNKCTSINIDVQYLIENYAKFLKKFDDTEELKPYYILDEKQLNKKLLEMQYDIKKIEEKLLGEVYLEQQHRNELINIKKQKPHEYESYKEKLQHIYRVTEILSQKLLTNYNSLISDLISNRLNEDKLKSNKEYFDEVFKYLAHRIGTFRHIDKEYEANKVDLISGIINTKDGYNIHLSDMGTGQSQSAYLYSLLNVEGDNRIIIALFDEIAMMDQKSLHPIYEKLCDLYNKNKLLLGMLVQKGDMIKIINIGEHYAK